MPFDIGESFAGLLPISTDKNVTRELCLWYFPSENPVTEDEIAIWLNDGPGYSSLEGLQLTGCRGQLQSHLQRLNDKSR